jgi:hypothetical protein
MCFSTTASFASGAILTVIGVMTIKKVESKSQIAFASIPFVFALQQFAEGFVWISHLQTTNYIWQELSTYCFLFAALVIWPAWVPISMYQMEKLKREKKILGAFALLGLFFSVLSIIYLLLYTSNSAVSGFHIRYNLNITFSMKVFFGLFYLIPTVLSNFVSSIKGVKMMGILILISYLISRFFYQDSVWCFFSALISIKVYSILKKENATYHPKIEHL